jgi:colanic acid/amylovoran biosynthesis glycosyltransferase
MIAVLAASTCGVLVQFGLSMKIAYLVNTYPKPSHTFIRREIAAIERLGVQVHRFAMRDDTAALVDAGDKAENARTEHVLNQGLTRLLPKALSWMVHQPRKSLQSLRLALRCGANGAAGGPGTGGRLRHLIYLLEAAYVAQRCSEADIHHIHAHFGTNSATVAMLTHALGGPTYSFTVHGPEEFDAPRALSFPEKIKRAAFVVAISSFGRSQLFRWSDLADWPKINVVHCGIDVDRFAEVAPLPQGAPKLVAIGRLSEQKGFPLLIQAMVLAVKDTPELHLAICGDGELRPMIEAEIAAHQLASHITLLGWRDEAGVRRAIAEAQALILPSFAEGLPMVVMEAMASARPIIATCINGVPELVTASEGWLVPAGDAQALANAITELANTPNESLARMGQSARLRVFDRHDANTEAAKLVELFSATLNTAV